MNCECLAAWVDSEPCICNEPIGAPMEISLKKVQEAERLARHIAHIDRALAGIGKRGGQVRTLFYDYGSHSDSRCPLEIYLPPDIAAAVIRTMRFHALVKLSETGVVSTWTGHRPVVSA